MDSLGAILVCFDYSKSQWELPVGVASAVRRCLVAWQTSPSAVDGGVPDGVAMVLSRTLVRHALVTFPTHTGRWGISFVHTSRAEDVQRAFDAEYFDWSQRGQIFFLSPTEAPPPALSEKHLRLAADRESLHKLADTGVTGLVLPGVDGNVAGFYTFTDSVRDKLLAGLRATCEQLDTQVREVTEAELIEALARR